MKNIFLSFVFGVVITLALSVKITNYLKDNVDFSYGVQCTLGVDECLEVGEQIIGEIK